MKNKKLYRILNYTLPIVTVIMIVVVYAIISKVVGVELITPSVRSTLKEFFVMFGKGDFYKAVG